MKMGGNDKISLRTLTLGYGSVYFSEGSFRSLGIFLPLNLLDPHLEFNLSLGDIAFIIATAYLAWNFKFILGVLLDLTPMIHGFRRRLWILTGQILRILGILMIIFSTSIIWIWIAAFIALTGDALIDMGADALLVDVAPPDWHGLGLGAGWASRAFGYSISALVVPFVVVRWGWAVGWSVFILYTLPVFVMLMLREPTNVEERTISKEAIAETFSHTKAAITFFLLAYFSGAAYALDPNRGFLGIITAAKLGISKPKTLAEYLANLPVVGYTMAFFGFSAALGALIMGYYTDKIGHKKSYLLSLTGFLGAFALWFFDPSLIGGWFGFGDPTFVGILIFSAILGFFEGWNFVAWETLIADSCPPQMAGFMFQYGMTGVHFSAFLVAVVSGFFISTSVYLALLTTFIIVAVGFIPALIFVPFKTSKIMINGSE